MSRAREHILASIRSALVDTSKTEPPASSAHQRAPSAAPLGESPSKADLIEQDKLCRGLISELTRVKASVYTAANVEAVVRTVIDIARKSNAASIVAWRFPLIEDRRLTQALQDAKIRLTAATAGNDADQFRATAAEAAVGLTGVDYAVADTGSLVLLSGDEKPRCASLLPPVHIAVVKAEQILPGLPELFEMLDSNGGGSSSAVTLITGPSRTADIELTLVVGVHGPQELHVIIETSPITGKVD